MFTVIPAAQHIFASIKETLIGKDEVWMINVYIQYITCHPKILIPYQKLSKLLYGQGGDRDV